MAHPTANVRRSGALRPEGPREGALDPPAYERGEAEEERTHEQQPGAVGHRPQDERRRVGHRLQQRRARDERGGRQARIGRRGLEREREADRNNKGGNDRHKDQNSITFPHGVNGEVQGTCHGSPRGVLSTNCDVTGVRQNSFSYLSHLDPLQTASHTPRARAVIPSTCTDMATSTVEPYTQLLSLAVHELRTPASVVGGYLRMLQRDMDEPLTARQRKLIDEAEKSCARLVTLISEMSDVGKIDAGLVTFARQPVDLSGVLREAAEHIHEGRDRDVHLALRADCALSMTGDRTRLRTAFEAIFRAILREKPGPALVAAECRRTLDDGRDCAVVVISDANTVQEAFERPRSGFDDQRGGLGLALPLARRVFASHGGAVWAPEPAAGQSATDDPVSRGSAIVVLPMAR